MEEGTQGEQNGLDSSYEGVGGDRGDEAPSRCILCQNGQGNILPLQCQRLLALPLTAHASLLEWLVTIMALSVAHIGLPFVHYGFSEEKMFKPFPAGALDEFVSFQKSKSGT